MQCPHRQLLLVCAGRGRMNLSNFNVPPYIMDFISPGLGAAGFGGAAGLVTTGLAGEEAAGAAGFGGSTGFT